MPRREVSEYLIVVALPYVLLGEVIEYMLEGRPPVNPDLMHNIRSRKEIIRIRRKERGEALEEDLEHRSWS